MDIAELIAWKEKRILLTKREMGALKDVPQIPEIIELIQELQEEIQDLENSIQADRQIQLTEAQVSGRKEWWHHPIIYFLVYVGGMITVKIFEFFLTKL